MAEEQTLFQKNPVLAILGALESFSGETTLLDELEGKDDKTLAKQAAALKKQQQDFLEEGQQFENAQKAFDLLGTLSGDRDSNAEKVRETLTPGSQRVFDLHLRAETPMQKLNTRARITAKLSASAFAVGVVQLGKGEEFDVEDVTSKLRGVDVIKIMDALPENNEHKLTPKEMQAFAANPEEFLNVVRGTPGGTPEQRAEAAKAEARAKGQRRGEGIKKLSVDTVKGGERVLTFTKPDGTIGQTTLGKEATKLDKNQIILDLSAIANGIEGVASDAFKDLSPEDAQILLDEFKVGTENPLTALLKQATGGGTSKTETLNLNSSQQKLLDDAITSVNDDGINAVAVQRDLAKRLSKAPKQQRVAIMREFKRRTRR